MYGSPILLNISLENPGPSSSIDIDDTSLSLFIDINIFFFANLFAFPIKFRIPYTISIDLGISKEL